MKVALSGLRKRDLELAIYFDDIYMQGDTPQLCQLNIQEGDTLAHAPGVYHTSDEVGASTHAGDNA